MKPFTVPVLIGMLTLLATDAAGWGWNKDAKISLHLEEVDGRESPPCLPSSGVPPCNQGEAHLTIQGDLETEYFVYVLLQDGDPDYGFNSVEFGITYDDAVGRGVDIESWHSCADSSFDSPDWFQKSGSFMRVAWTNCQFAPIALDLDKRPSKVIGVFKVIAHSPDVMSVSPISPEQYGNKEADYPVCPVRSCPGVVVGLSGPIALGSIAFGKKEGCDPCKGPWSPYATFQELNANELSSLRIHLGYMGASHFGGEFPDLILESKSSGEHLGMFLPFFHPTLRYIYLLSVRPTCLEVPQKAMASIIEKLSTLADFTDGDVDTQEVCMGVQVVATYRGTNIGFESIVNPFTAEEVLERIREGLRGEWDMMLTLDSFACHLGVPSGPPATNVSPSVKVQFEGQARETARDTWSRPHHHKVRLTNVSKSTLPPPISLAIKQQFDMEVLSPPPSRRYYGVCGAWNYMCFDLSKTAGLRPGETIESDLNGTLNEVDLDPIIFSGPGVRGIDGSKLRR